MGVQYFTVKEIINNKSGIKKVMGKIPDFIESGEIQKILKQSASKSATLLDIGCSTGRMFHLAQETGFAKDNVWGVDIDDYLIDTHTINVKICDVNKENLPFDDESFDVITAIYVVEHLENPFHFFRECCRILKKGGLCVVAIPSGNSIFDKINFVINGRLLSYHTNNNHISFMLDPVYKKTVRTMFDEIDVKYGRVWIPGVRPKWLYTWLPRNRIFSYTKMYVLRKK